MAALREHAKYPVPESVAGDVREMAARYGRVVLHRDGDWLVFTCLDRPTAERVARDKGVGPHVAARVDDICFRVRPAARGVLKQALVAAGFPAEDLAGYVTGEALEVGLRTQCRSGAALELRDYQREAVEAFHASGSVRGGSGVIVLPCGSGTRSSTRRAARFFGASPAGSGVPRAP